MINSHIKTMKLVLNIKYKNTTNKRLDNQKIQWNFSTTASLHIRVLTINKTRVETLVD